MYCCLYVYLTNYEYLFLYRNFTVLSGPHNYDPFIADND